jgi:hypothetical protein
MEVKIVNPIQNPNRYIITNDGWQVSSVSDSPNGNINGEIVPLTIPKGKEIQNSSIYTVLEVDDIVIQIDDKYLISPNTMVSFQSSLNPHWDIQQNGTILGKAIGKSIPIIKIDVSKLMESGKEQDQKIANAGVESVEYIYETELEMGIPKGLINQLNYTLKEGAQRPGDSFSLWDMNLGDDTLYSIQALNVSTAQEDGKLDTAKLKDFLGSIGDRLSLLRKDFNSIKDTFYNGVPPINKGKIQVQNRVASTEGTQDSAPRQTVIKETETLTVVSTPNSTEVTQSVTPIVESPITTEVVSELNAVIGDAERNRRILEESNRRRG